MKYDPNVHDLGYVIRDLDSRVDRAERALRALTEDPGNPFASTNMARFELQRDPGDETDHDEEE